MGKLYSCNVIPAAAQSYRLKPQQLILFHSPVGYLGSSCAGFSSTHSRGCVWLVDLMVNAAFSTFNCVWGVPTWLPSGALCLALQLHLYHFRHAPFGHDGPLQQHRGILSLEDLLGWAGRSKLAPCTCVGPCNSPPQGPSSSSGPDQFLYIMEGTF